MRRAAASADQAGQTTTHFLFGTDANGQGGPFASARHVRDALVSYALEVEDEVMGSKPIHRVVLVVC
jgi:hypothetical protein